MLRQCFRGRFKARCNAAVNFGKCLCEHAGTFGEARGGVVEGAIDFLDTCAKGRRGLFGTRRDALVGVLKDLGSFLVQHRGCLDHLVAQGSGDDDGAALERAAHILHANGKRFFHGLRALFDDPRLFGEDLIDAQGLVFDHGIEGRAVLIDLGDIRVERLTKAVACPGKLLNLLSDPGLEGCTCQIELLHILGERTGKPLVRFFKGLDLTLCSLTHARLGGVDTLNAFIEMRGHLRPVLVETLAEFAGGVLQHDAGRCHEVGELAAERRFACFDGCGNLVFAMCEGVGDLPGALDEGFIDAARTRFQGRIELLCACVERFGAGGELGNECPATFGDGILELAKTGVEFARHGVGRLTQRGEQRRAAGLEQRVERPGRLVGTLGKGCHAFIEQIAQRLGRVLGLLGEGAEARIENLRQGLFRILCVLAEHRDTRIKNVAKLGRGFFGAIGQSRDARIEQAADLLSRLVGPLRQRSHPRVEQRGEVLCCILRAPGQGRDACVEQACDSVTGGGDAFRKALDAIVDALVQSAASAFELLQQRLT